jgi:hypothetical protein
VTGGIHWQVSSSELDSLARAAIMIVMIVIINVIMMIMA